MNTKITKFVATIILTMSIFALEANAQLVQNYNSSSNVSASVLMSKDVNQKTIEYFHSVPHSGLMFEASGGLARLKDEQRPIGKVKANWLLPNFDQDRTNDNPYGIRNNPGDVHAMLGGTVLDATPNTIRKFAPSAGINFDTHGGFVAIGVSPTGSLKDRNLEGSLLYDGQSGSLALSSISMSLSQSIWKDIIEIYASAETGMLNKNMNIGNHRNTGYGTSKSGAYSRLLCSLKARIGEKFYVTAGVENETMNYKLVNYSDDAQISPKPQSIVGKLNNTMAKVGVGVKFK